MLITILNWFPLRQISRLAGYLTTRNSSWFNSFLIKLFIKIFHVDLTEASRKNINQYKNFNDFFTRELSTETLLKLIPNNNLTSPVDGIISAWGNIEKGQLLQAKRFDYDLSSLLINMEDMHFPFINGSFITIYLAPKNYHRVHMPLAGQLKKMVYIPGQLFPVNTWAAQNVPQLFCKNERVACLFSTKIGPLIIILVGAFLVGSISTSWHGEVNANHIPQPQVWDYTNQSICLKQYQEMGLFKYGSTVILLLPSRDLKWIESLKKQNPIQLGNLLADLDK